MRAALLSLVLVLAAAVPAAAQEPVPAPTPVPTGPTIAPGVTAGGIDLSGMTIPQAEAALEQLRPAVERPVVVAVAGRRFRLGVRKVEQDYDTNRTARRAFHAGEDTPPAAGETIDVPLAIEFIRTPIRKFVARAARKVHVAPRDASVRITLTRIFKRQGRTGRRLPTDRVNRLVEKALADPRRPRVIKPGRKKLRPDVRTRELKKRYRTIITIDRSSFRLRLFKKLRYSRSYGVAVGQPAYPTPTGLFAIQSKQVNPTWTAPNSPWAGEMAGQSVSGSDPNNPLKARWMGVTGAVGIHGTGQEYSIGTAASHGCIRMRVADVIDLYDRVPLGAPVLIR